MNQINFNKLYYFYVVAKEGSIKQASKKLHLTSSTISGQIRELEEGLGFDVFHRKHRKLELNSDGRFLLKKAEKIFVLAEEMLHSLPGQEKKRRLELRIGAIQSLANSFVYDFSMKAWKDSSVKVSFIQSSLEDLVERMDNDQLDVVLSDSPYRRSKRFRSTSLGRDKVVVVSSMELKGLKKGFPTSLSAQPYLAFSNTGQLQEEIEQFFERKGIVPERVGEVDDVTLMRLITENSQCFSILPLRAAKESIKHNRLTLLGELEGVQCNLWAIMSTLAKNKVRLRKLVNDYFYRSR